MEPSSLRILHAFNLYGNPSEVWGFRLLEALHRAGVQQGVVAAQYWPGNYPEASWPVFRLPFWSEYYKGNLLTRQVSYYLTSVGLRHELHAGQWGLIHAHFGPAGWRFAALAEHLHIPLVVSFYGIDYLALPKRRQVWKKRYQRLFQKASCVLAEGPHGVQLLQQMGCPEHKIRVQKLGVHLGAAPEKVKLKNQDQLRLVQVASFVDKKGHADSIRALSLALPKCPDITLTLAGDGATNRNKLVQLADSLGVADKVFFRDFIPYANLRTFLADYDVFIHPSLQTQDLDNEGGVPTILFEAMAAGLPVISTQHCDIPTVVLHQINGFLAPENDANTLSQCISTFYAMNDSEMMPFRRAARAHVTQFFDIQQSAKNLAMVYNSIIHDFIYIN